MTNYQIILLGLYTLVFILSLVEMIKETKRRRTSRLLREKIACKDFKGPVYVYQDLSESFIYLSDKELLGIRISKDLVIHKFVGNDDDRRADTNDKNDLNHGGWLIRDLKRVLRFWCTSMLDTEDVKILRKNWDVVDKMRLNAGLSPLPKGYFWAGTAWYDSYAAHYLDENLDTSDIRAANIIMKA